MSLTLIVPLLLFMLTLALAAWGLPLATAFARTWTRLYTRLAPAEQRERRIEETEYHLFAQTEGDREAGYKSSEIGLRIMGRVVCGVLACDLTPGEADAGFVSEPSRREGRTRSAGGEFWQVHAALVAARACQNLPRPYSICPRGGSASEEPPVTEPPHPAIGVKSQA
jgi:hypothetical protein